MNGSQTGPLEGPVVGSRRIGTGLRSRPENHRAASPIKPRARRKAQASSSLAQKLSGVLQQSIKQGHSDAQVASKLIRILKPYLPQPSREENSGDLPAPRTPGTRSTPQTRVVAANSEVSIITAEWANKPICIQAQAALDAIQSGASLGGTPLLSCKRAVATTPSPKPCLILSVLKRRPSGGMPKPPRRFLVLTLSRRSRGLLWLLAVLVGRRR